MKSISLYVDKNSIFHNLHSFTKLFYLLTMILVPAIVGSIWGFAAAAAFSFLLLVICGLLKKAMPFVLFTITIVLIIFIVQGLTYPGNETVMFSLGKIEFYSEGIMYALRIGLNFWNILFAFALLILTTKPKDMVEDCEQIGLSPKFGYIIASVFQIIPQMTGTMSTITDAQRSRGMETEGKLLTRAKAFIPLMAPVVMSSLINTKERAMALEIRGFNADIKKTYLYTRKLKISDKICLFMMGLSILSSIVFRVVKWLILK